MPGIVRRVIRHAYESRAELLRRNINSQPLSKRIGTRGFHHSQGGWYDYRISELGSRRLGDSWSAGSSPLRWFQLSTLPPSSVRIAHSLLVADMQLDALERWAVGHKDSCIIALFCEDTARVLKFMVCRVDPVGLVAVMHSSTQNRWRERTLSLVAIMFLCNLGGLWVLWSVRSVSRLHKSKMECQASSSVRSSP
jgi:hypothetical protein